MYAILEANDSHFAKNILCCSEGKSDAHFTKDILCYSEGNDIHFAKDIISYSEGRRRLLFQEHNMQSKSKREADGDSSARDII